MTATSEATSEHIEIPHEQKLAWQRRGFSVYELMDLCGGEDEFYEALFAGRIPSDWAVKAKAAIDPQEMILIRLRRVESKLDTLMSMWLGEDKG